jgi:hypothetical protein
MCTESLHSNCRGSDNSEPIIVSLPSNDKQTLVLLLLRAFRGFYGFNSYHMGETRHNILVYSTNSCIISKKNAKTFSVRTAFRDTHRFVMSPPTGPLPHTLQALDYIERSLCRLIGHPEHLIGRYWYLPAN